VIKGAPTTSFLKKYWDSLLTPNPECYLASRPSASLCNFIIPVMRSVMWIES